MRQKNAISYKLDPARTGKAALNMLTNTINITNDSGTLATWIMQGINPAAEFEADFGDGRGKITTSVYKELINRLFSDEFVSRHPETSHTIAMSLTKLLRETWVSIPDCDQLKAEIGSDSNMSPDQKQSTQKAREHIIKLNSTLLAGQKLETLRAAIQLNAITDIRGSSLHDNGRIRFPTKDQQANLREPEDRYFEQVKENCAKVHKIMPELFREMMEDDNLWASRSAASAYADAAQEINAPGGTHDDMIWLRRLLEKEQKETKLAKYTNKSDPPRR